MIYFVRSIGAPFVKIGVAADVAERVKTLQTAYPQELRVQAVLPGSFATERGLHELFESSHHKGEWFRYNDKMKYFLRAIRAHPDESNIITLYRISMQMRLNDKAKRLSRRGNDKLKKRIRHASFARHT